MDFSLGRISGQLADPGEKLSPDLIDLLNANIAPPEKISAGDINIRAMYIVSDEVNCYGGKFPVDEHGHLTRLLIDSPVMVGHRKDKLPVGRTFHARLIKRKGRNWIKSYFYWLKNAEGAANLRENIDGGIYKECSIGFTFALPECSVCGQDIRLCPHEPLESYEVDGTEQSCYFNYRKIEKVLETSLVYRGAINDTSVSNELQTSPVQTDPALAPPDLIEIRDLEILQDEREYVIMPRYESVAVAVGNTNGKFQLLASDGGSIAESLAERFAIKGLPADTELPARLVGYRGKERCRLESLRKYLKTGSEEITRLVLMLLPHPQLPNLSGNNKAPFDIRLIPFRQVTLQDLLSKANEIKTRDGVEIWPLQEGRLAKPAYCFKPDDRVSQMYQSYKLTIDPFSGDGYLWLYAGRQPLRVRISDFDAELLSIGRRFVADLIPDRIRIPNFTEGKPEDGRLSKCNSSQGAYRLVTEGYLKGEYLLRPIILDGAKRFLFFRRAATRCGSD